jgi:glycosyltransferase involved in cell wall biosynthesis
MKILLYTHAFAPKVGGQETIVMFLAQRLAISALPGSLEPQELVVATPTPSNGMNDAALPFRVVRQPNLATLFSLMHQADVVHLAGPALLPLVMGLTLRKPMVVEHHGFQAVCPNGQLLYEPEQAPCPGHFMAGRYGKCIGCNAFQGYPRSVKMWLLTFPRRWLCQHVSANILPSEWLGTLLQLNRMKKIVHGIPPPEAAPARRVVPQLPAFAFLGRLVSTKGVRVLLEAAQQLNAKGLAFRVKIIGQGPAREALEQLVEDLRIQDCVQFLGYVRKEELEECLAGVAAVVMPSLGGEVFGLVAAENMQRGRLVIVSDIGALAEVVGDAGLKFMPGDVAGLARCMEDIVANPTFAEGLREKASHRAAQTFADDQMAKEHLRLYEELCGR